MNFTASAVVPSLIEIVSRPHVTCDPSVAIDRRPSVVVPLIEGTVRCDCPGVDTLAGADVSLRRDDGAGEWLRQVRTDRGGSFRIGGVAPGRYVLEIGANGHSRWEIACASDPPPS